MRNSYKLNTKEIAFTICFTALYTLLSFLPISPIIGLPGRTITAASITAPLIGILFGPYIGSISTILGGTIGFFGGSFSSPSFASGIFAALCAGMLQRGKRGACAFVYFSLLLLFAFYPFVGPFWLYPPLLWFQIAGFLILISPLQSEAVRKLDSGNSPKLFFAFFVSSLTSALAGQIAGSLTFEFIYWPVLIPDLNAWTTNWQIITILYPIERTVIAFGTAVVGVALQKVLTVTNIMPNFDAKHQRQKAE